MDNKAREAHLKQLQPEQRKVQSLEYRVMDLEARNIDLDVFKQDLNKLISVFGVDNELLFARRRKIDDKLQALKDGLWIITQEQEKKEEPTKKWSIFDLFK